MDACQSLGLPDIPLEQVNRVNSLDTDDRFKNPFTNMSTDADETMPPKADHTTAHDKVSPFHSVGFKTDVTERIIKVLLEKATVHPKVGSSYFGWKGVGFQVGVCFNRPPLLDLSFAARFLSIHQSTSEIPHHMRKSPPEQLLAYHCATQSQDKGIEQNKDERISPYQQDDMQDQEDSMLFCKSCLVGPSQYKTDCIHCWSFVLLKSATPPENLILIPYKRHLCALVLQSRQRK
jgi:hypothetical protein